VIVAGIPAYNEEESIAKVILIAQRYVDIVVVCDDGSQDLTADIAQRLGARVVKLEKNMGYGVAIRTLFEQGRRVNADVLVTLDADGQHDAREIPTLIRPILENKADIVLGSRFLQSKNHVPRYRRLGIKVLTKMTKGSTQNGAVSDAQCGFRAYGRKAMESMMLDEDGMDASAEVLMKAGALDLVVTEVPVEVHYEGLKTSTHHPLKHGVEVLFTIIRLVVEERPLVYLGLPGMALLGLGMFFGLWTLQLYYISNPHQIVTNVALAAVTFVLLGMFFIFTAITLYAIIRAVRRERTTVNNGS
jgi:glycosyltransferase involved in cell wall biosynthesis